MIPGWNMRRGRTAGLIIAAVWVTAWVGSVATRKVWMQSFSQTAEALNSAVIVVWPFAGAVGVAQAVYARRSGVLDVVEAWPGPARSTWLLTEIVATWRWACLGGILGFTGSMAWSGMYGSPPSAVPLLGLTIGLIGVAAMLAVGAWVGCVLPHYALALVVMAMFYFVPWLMMNASIFEPESNLVGATLMIGYAGSLSWKAWVGGLLYYGSMGIAFAVAIIVTVDRSRRSLRSWIALMAAFAVMAASFLLLQHLHERSKLWTERGPEAWHCVDVGSAGSRACLPHDLAWLQERHANVMTRLDDVVHAAVPDLPPLLYAAEDSADPAWDGLRLAIPTLLEDPEEGWASGVATYWPGSAEYVEPDLDESACVATWTAVSERLTRVARGQSSDASVFVRLLPRLAGCNAQHR